MDLTQTVAQTVTDNPGTTAAVVSALAALVTAVAPQLLKLVVRMVPSSQTLLAGVQADRDAAAAWRHELQEEIRNLRAELQQSRVELQRERSGADGWERRYNRVLRENYEFRAMFALDPDRTLPEGFSAMGDLALSTEFTTPRPPPREETPPTDPSGSDPQR